jgi:HTH-type transcriptional regulator/antitoxin HipB
MTDFVARTPQQLGAVLQGYRYERKLTQAAVGTRTGLSQAAISQIESDPTTTSLSRIYRILSALDLELVIRHRSSGDPKSEW